MFYSYNNRRKYIIEKEIGKCKPNNIDNIKCIISQIYKDSESEYGCILNRHVNICGDNIVINIRFENGRHMVKKINIGKYIDNSKSINIITRR
jgi:hypothetical protein